MIINVFDVGIIMLCIMFFIVGVKSGFIKELSSLIGTIIVFVIAYSLKGTVGNIMCLSLPFFRFTGSLEGISAINILLYQVLAFILLFALLLVIYTIIMGISNVLQKLVDMTIILIPISKILGGVVSLIKGYIILFVVFLFLMIPLGSQPVFRESKLVNNLLYKTPFLSNEVEDVINAEEDVASLISKVSKKKINSHDANISAIKIMLKYKICDKGIIKDLVYKNKLYNAEGIEKELE